MENLIRVSHLLARLGSKVCEKFEEQITVEHILFKCLKFNYGRQKNNNGQRRNNIISYLKGTKLYNQI